MPWFPAARRAARAALFSPLALTSTLAWLAGAAAPSPVPSPARLSAQDRQQPVFQSGVELIAVDVRVVDRDGRPVGGLEPDQFQVTVDGKPRRVVSADFVEYAAGDPERAAPVPVPAPAARPPAAANDPRAEAAPRPQGRLIYLAIDQGSFKPLAARGAMEAARRFIDRLQPADRVGVVAFPAPGPSVPASRDHGAARAATAQVVGRAMPFRSEGLDKSLSLSEAIDIRSNDAMVLQRVLARECAGLRGGTRVACELDVRNTAMAIGLSAEMQATRSLSGMEAVVRGLAQVPGRKTLVLVSAGLPVSDRSGRDLQLLPFLSSLGREAAAANLNFYILHVDSGFLDAFSAENRTISDALDRDLSLMSGGLEAIAGSSGGSLVRIVAGADHAFDRVLLETSAAYILGVEPAESDRDGKAHRIAVKVAVPGVQVRSRREFVLRAAASPAAGPAAPRATRPAPSPAVPIRPIVAAFESPLQVPDLPIAVATHVMTARGGRHTVYISADIGDGFAGPAEVEVMYAFFDPAGRTHAPVERAGTLRPSRSGRPGSLAFSIRDELEPGSYSLRFAASDASGRSGSVSHRVAVATTAGSGVDLSDLLLTEPQQDRGAPPVIVAGDVLRVPEVEAHLEIAARAPTAAVTNVTVNVASRSDQAALVSSSAFIVREAGDGQPWSAVAYLDLGDLQPGDYVMSAVVSDDDREIGRVERPVRIEPPSAPRLSVRQITRARADIGLPAPDAHGELVPACAGHPSR